MGKTLKFRQWKGNNSAITDDTLIKLHVHNLTMVIYIQYKLNEIPSIGYLVMAERGQTTPNLYPSTFGGGGGIIKQERAFIEGGF